MPPQIADYDVYTKGMRKSMKDKLFWFDKIPEDDFDLVIDYGCADGQFLKEVRDRFPEKFLVGIDIDDVMLQKASENIGSESEFIKEDSSREFVLKHVVNNAVLNLSSVIHEVYSYKKDKDIYDFWKMVFESNYKYICIRDMAISDSVALAIGLPMAFDEDKIPLTIKGRARSFKKVWGSFIEAKNVVHFLLKYRYEENWNREVHENYLPLTYEEMLIKIPENYEVVYKEHYILPFLKDKVKEDFGINLNVKTHMKLILRRKDV